jgi:hypothetical protein
MCVELLSQGRDHGERRDVVAVGPGSDQKLSALHDLTVIEPDIKARSDDIDMR